MPRSSANTRQAAAAARAPLRPLATLRVALQDGQALTSAELQNTLAKATSPAEDRATRSQAMTLALQATWQTPELPGAPDLARLVTLKQNATEPVLARQAGNILGLLLHHAHQGGTQPVIVIGGGRRLPPHKVPAVLDMAGHIQMSLGVPTPAAINKMVRLPHMHPVANEVTLFTSPLQLARTLLGGTASDMRYVMPALLHSLDRAATVNKQTPPRFRGAGPALRAVVRELTSPTHQTLTASLLPNWPKAVQKLFAAPQRQGPT